VTTFPFLWKCKTTLHYMTTIILANCTHSAKSTISNINYIIKPSSDSILFCFTTFSLATNSDHFSFLRSIGFNFRFIPRALFYRGCKINKNKKKNSGRKTSRKCSKYTELSSTHEFQPVAVESHGPLSDTTVFFLEELGRKITDRSGEPLEA